MNDAAADDWGPWVLLAVLVACFYAVWDAIYYRRLMATRKASLAALFALMLLMALAFALFRVVLSVASRSS
jgi:hypothetical protein